MTTTFLALFMQNKQFVNERERESRFNIARRRMSLSIPSISTRMAF